MEGQPMNGAYVGKKESKVACWLRSEWHTQVREHPPKPKARKTRDPKENELLCGILGCLPSDKKAVRPVGDEGGWYHDEGQQSGSSNDQGIH